MNQVTFLTRLVKPTTLALTLLLLGGCKAVDPEQSELDAEFSTKQYRQSIRDYGKELRRVAVSSPAGTMSGQEYFDKLFAMVVRKYYFNDRGELIQSCSADIKKIFWAFYREHATHGRDGEPSMIAPKGIYPKDDDGSSVRHFFGAAGIESYIYLGKAVQRAHEWKTNRGRKYPVDSYRDDAYAFLGAEFATTFKSWTNQRCLCRVKLISDSKIKFSDLYPKAIPLKGVDPQVSHPVANRYRDSWLASAKSNMNRLFSKCN